MELDDQKRLLALHALKEVVTYTSHGQLENITELLWGPLFENSENAEESTRNVAAACIGKLITMHPARYLPQIHVSGWPCRGVRLTLTYLNLSLRPDYVMRKPQRGQQFCLLFATLLLSRHNLTTK